MLCKYSDFLLNKQQVLDFLMEMLNAHNALNFCEIKNFFIYDKRI